jgi:gamma-glutamyltranspeptidase/glutathione hydrolase
LPALLVIATIPEVGAGSARSRFAVATESAPATRAAVSILERGGSAVDAAIAASAMLGLTAGVSCGLGGGGFALVYDARDRSTSFLDYRETAPKRYDEATRRSNQRGAQIGVPGEPAGLVELHRRWGTQPLAELLAPAATAAENGFVVSSHFAKMLGFRGAYAADPAFAAIFAPLGAPAKDQERIQNRALGATLRRLGSEGTRPFYEGVVASELVEVARAAGSPIEASDFSDYRVASREPLRARWEGYQVVTAPPPSGGGLLLLETIGLYSAAELAGFGWQSADYTHMMAEAMRGAIADRLRAVGDPAFVPPRTGELLAPARLSARRARIAPDRTHAPQRFPLEEHGTTHLVVADEKGNVVSLTTTINSPFGSGVVAPRAGILLNDELADFTGPELAAALGSAPDPNRPRGGARPVSSMTPTLVLRDELPVVALGGSGGLRIPVNVTQAFVCRLVFDKDAQTCVNAPRFFTPPTGPTLLYNTEQLPPANTQLDLMEKGEQIRTPQFGDTTAVQMVAIERSAGAVGMQAAADRRKGGTASVDGSN